MDTSCPDYDYHLYPLTSLQIGDIKTNLSQAFLYFASDSKKFFIIVDNQSWRKIKHSRSTHIRAFVTTSYRTSPFRNTRPLQRSSSFSLISSNCGIMSLFKWFPNIVDKALHGFIVFEVSWKGVRGINYLNELQTDGSIALEVKSLTKREFNSIDQALSLMSSWFSGTQSEEQKLRTSLIHLQGKVPSRSAQEIIVSSDDSRHNDDDTYQDCEVLSEDEFLDARESFHDDDKATYTDCHELEEEPAVPRRNAEQNMEPNSDIEPMVYEDILLLCRFNNRDLPFQLKRVITSDLRLLTLLESGLPTWVIFLQSYPLFCALYRPWMRPLFRTLYILVSLVTVIIGFYDLYKNVPLLKSTVSHLCGPLFKWIESWDMISRIRYLGTMLFLQNFEKAVKGLLMMTRWLKLLVSVVKETLSYPSTIMADFFMPLWSFLSHTATILYDFHSDMVEFLCVVVDNIDDFFIPPFELVYSYLSSLAILVHTILNSIWELVQFSTQGCLFLANYLGSLVYDVYEVLADCFGFAFSSIGQLTYFFRTQPNSSHFSYWHSVYKDLFSKVFRSLRSVIRVLYAFIASCKRHRLSIYNYVRAILQKLSNIGHFSSKKCSCRLGPQPNSHIKVEAKECEHCK